MIGAAQEVFAERGIEAGIPEIAARAGVGKGTVYRNFENKDGLVSAVLAATLDRFSESAVVALEEEDAWQAFRDLLGDAVCGKMEDGGFGMGLELAVESEAVITARARASGLLAELMEKAKDQGTMRSDLSAEDAGVLFGGICRILNERKVVDREVWRRHSDQVADAFRVQPS